MSNPFYVTSPVFSSGTVTFTIMAHAGADVGSVNYTVGYDTTAGNYGTVTGPAGWFVQANSGTAGSVLVGELGTTGVAVSADEAVGTVTFVPTAQATIFDLSVTVTDWSTESGTEDASQYNLGSFNVPLTCFAEGTLIETATGPAAVETLAVGNHVLLAKGGTAEVVWLGRRYVDCRRHPKPEQVWPVRVLAGAFGPGQPARTLFLSPGHAVFVNDVLVPVKLLINGTVIAQVRVEALTYYHVELPRHDLLLAEGLAVESYLDVGDRANFENGGRAVTLHPDFAARRWELRWEAEGCAQLCVVGPQLEGARAVVAGAARAATQPDEPQAVASR